jgi:hypothetical protein
VLNLFFAGILKVNDENSRIQIRILGPDPLVRVIYPRIRIRTHPTECHGSATLYMTLPYANKHHFHWLFTLMRSETKKKYILTDWESPALGLHPHCLGLAQLILPEEELNIFEICTFICVLKKVFLLFYVFIFQRSNKTVGQFLFLF